MRTKVYLFLLGILFLQSATTAQMVVGTDTLVGNEWIDYNASYYKFTVEDDGVYRITGDQMQAAGMSNVSGTNIRVYSLGKQIPIHVSTNGNFSSTDYIEFYGQKNRSEMDRFLYYAPGKDMLNPFHSLYSDKRPYYLTTEAHDTPLRVNQIPNDVSNPPAAETYLLTKQQTVFSSAHYDPYFQAGDGSSVSYSSYMHAEGFSKGSESTSTINVNITDKAGAGPDATLHVRMASANYSIHNFPVTWNDQNIATISANNIHIIDTNFTIPLNQLIDNNQLKFLSNNEISRMAIAEISLLFPKTITAALAGQASLVIEADNASQYFVLEGFSHGTDAPVIYTADGASRMTGAFETHNYLHFVWPAVSEETNIYIADPSSIKSVASITKITFPDWLEDDTEFVIISHPGLMEPGTSSDYAQYRSSVEGGSYRSKVYSILDIYEQFGYGIEKHPQAVRNFVEFMQRQWPSTKMIFIVGRAIEYNRSRVNDGSWESNFFVPTFGKPGSDQLLAATLWDLVARYPIARLAVNNPGMIDVYLDKVKEYETALQTEQTLEDKEWMKHVIHISGGEDAGQQESFRQIMNTLGEELAVSDFGAKIFSFQKESSEFVEQSQSELLEKLLEKGSALINYLGHSSTSTFEYNIIDPTQWKNRGRYPVVSAMGCSAGAIHGNVQSLSDRYVQVANEGAIAFISGSGSQFANSLINWAEPWYQYFGNTHYGAPIGESILYGLREVSSFINPALNVHNPSRYLLEQQTTQGDPALRMYPLPGPDYVIDGQSVLIAPKILDARQDSFDLEFKIVNLGRNLGQNVAYRISLRSSSNVVQDLIVSTAFIDHHEIVIKKRLPLAIDKPGVYRLLIVLDEPNAIAELPAPDAENNNRLEDKFGVEGISLVVVDNVITAAYPPDYSIVNTTPVTLVATSSNAFINSTTVILEVDTNGLFENPIVHREFPNQKGALKWTLDFTPVPGQEYFWRVSADSISPEQSYIWSRRSFTYLPDKSRGWSQSHFHQLTDDVLQQLAADSNDYSFDFGRKVNNFRMLNRYHDIPAGLVPYFYKDGQFIAKLAQTFRNSDVHGFVVAIDSVTGKFFYNPPGSAYGSFPFPNGMEGFAYTLTTPEGRQNMINLIENIIPDGYYVFFYTYQHTNYKDYRPEEWAADEATFGKSVFSVIENQFPGSNIRSLEETGSLPYIVLFQKNKGPIEEKIAVDSNDVIEISFDAGSFYPSGTYVSVPVGPSSSWSTIEHDFTAFNDTTGRVTVSAYALDRNFSDTLWISHDITEPELDISHIDAGTHPYIRLQLSTLDSATYAPARINYWRVLYEGIPEFIVNTGHDFYFNDDTLFQGQVMSLRTSIENLSPYHVDSLVVTLQVLGNNSQTEPLRSVIRPFGAQATLPIYFERSTADLSGQYQVVMEVNPERLVPEDTYSNNIGILPMFVRDDDNNPVLDVTFDGYHIVNGSLVGSRPLIVSTLHDENEHVRLTDTSSFEIYLTYPSDINPRRLYFSTGDLQLIPAPDTGKNIASVRLTPYLNEDGTYALLVKAKDRSGNPSGDNDYHITFRVINDPSVSYIYNYPNPFSEGTQFIYTLTGESAPDFYKIEIVSLAGILVREITQQELGLLAPGNHATHYSWDGSDDNGNPLAAGMYLYRLVVKDANGQDYRHYGNDGDGKGWGKLILIR